MLSAGMLRRVALVRTEVSEERRLLQEPHGVTSQKTTFLIVTAVKTSNLTLH
jgi:ABC-type nitrate/sulfonate/bicarbonate transport system ATPase subunit